MTTRTEYRIFRVSDDGLLKRPQDNDYSRTRNAFRDCETLGEAQLAIGAMSDYGEYVVLPVVLRLWDPK